MEKEIERYKIEDKNLVLRIIKLRKEKLFIINLIQGKIAHGSLAKGIFKVYETKNFNKIRQLLNKMYLNLPGWPSPV